jgi:uncharacterized damage-inducible protein DinB
LTKAPRRGCDKLGIVATTNLDQARAALGAATHGAERQVLEAMLEYYRVIIKRKVDGVSEADLRRRFVPSQTTLGGLLKHLATVERRWFAGALTGAAEPFARDNPTSWQLEAGDTLAGLLADYDRACAESRDVAAKLDVDDVRSDLRYGDVSLRFVYVHMIDETARHAGHADILRELIDGSTGD